MQQPYRTAPQRRHYLLLARHASCGQDGRLIGSTDASLNELGRQQIAALGEFIGRQPVQRIVCSPLRRCLDSARPLAGRLNLPLHEDADLREVNFGAWEGLTFDEVAQRDPEAVQRWTEAPDAFAFPGGERIAEFRDRVARAVERLCAASEERVLAVTHGGVIRAAICLLLGLPSSSQMLFEVKHAAVTTLTLFGNRGVLSGLNETAWKEA